MTTYITQQLSAIRNNITNLALMLTSNRDEAVLLVEATEHVLESREIADDCSQASLRSMAMKVMRELHKAAVITADVNDDDNSTVQYTIAVAQFAEPENCHHYSDIERAILGVDRHYREPLALHLAGYNVAEIAMKLRMDVENVRLRISKGRNQMCMCL